jgi:hypothetical protein
MDATFVAEDQERRQDLLLRLRNPAFHQVRSISFNIAFLTDTRNTKKHARTYLSKPKDLGIALL